MELTYLIPIVVGFMAVLQGGLNRKLALDWGLGAAVYLNCLVFFVLGSVFIVALKFAPHAFPTPFRIQSFLKPFEWWQLLPGIFGFCLVTGLPYAIAKLGATKVFLSFVVSQIIVSILWDIYAENIEFHWMKLTGTALCLLGILCIYFAPSR